MSRWSSMKTFKLRFSTDLIRSLSDKYGQELSDRERDLTDKIEKQVFPSYSQKKYLKKKEFLDVCKWKTPRSKSRCEKNSPEFIKEISEIVIQTRSERLRIEALTLLHGVGWPTASVFLHFAFTDQYPILDVRALWSLNIEEPPVYDFDFWQRYTKFCRELADSNGVGMRTLDEALWRFSKDNQLT